MKPQAKFIESQIHHKCNKGPFSEWTAQQKRAYLLISLIHDRMKMENQVKGNEELIFTWTAAAAD